MKAATYPLCVCACESGVKGAGATQAGGGGTLSWSSSLMSVD